MKASIADALALDPKLARALLRQPKYSEDQPRDDHGRFGETSGSSAPISVNGIPIPEDTMKTLEFGWNNGILIGGGPGISDYLQQMGHSKEDSDRLTQSVPYPGLLRLYSHGGSAEASAITEITQHLQDMDSMGETIVDLAKVETTLLDEFARRNGDPTLYRATGGSEDRVIESWTTDPEGAQMQVNATETEALTPDVSAKWSDLKDSGYSVLGGVWIPMGYSGEKEITLIRLDKITGTKHLAKYSEDQPRDDHGRFGETNGGSGFREFADGAAADKWGRSTQEWAKTANGADLAHLQDYTYYVGLNSALRGGGMTGTLVSQRDGLDHLFQQPGAVIPEDVRTYRAWVGSGPSKEIGATFTDRGFTSTTLDPSKDDEFDRSYTAMDMSPTMVAIDVPAGTRALYVGTVPDTFTAEQQAEFRQGYIDEAVAQAAELGFSAQDVEYERERSTASAPSSVTWLSGDSELILDRGTTYQITGRDADGTVHVQVVGQRAN